MTEPGAGNARIKVWDLPVRISHWTLVLGVVCAWLTRHGSGRWHEWLGYAVLGVVLVRIVWGWIGTKHARFAQFVRPPAPTLAYARLVFAHREPRYLGHNPLGGWMIVVLIVVIIGVCATGWLYTTDAYWGVKWVEELHEGLTNFLLVLVALHIGGVILSSRQHRENLVAAMFSGRKRAPADNDIA